MEAEQRDPAGGQAGDPCFEMIPAEEGDKKARNRSSASRFLKRSVSAVCSLPHLLRPGSRRSQTREDEECTPLLEPAKSASRTVQNRRPWNSSQVSPAPQKEFPAPTVHRTHRSFNAPSLTSPPKNAGPGSTPAKTARSGLSPSNTQLPDPWQTRTRKHPGSSAPVVPRLAPHRDAEEATGLRGTPAKRVLLFPQFPNESETFEGGDAAAAVGPGKTADDRENGSEDKVVSPSALGRKAQAQRTMKATHASTVLERASSTAAKGGPVKGVSTGINRLQTETRGPHKSTLARVPAPSTPATAGRKALETALDEALEEAARHLAAYEQLQAQSAAQDEERATFKAKLAQSEADRAEVEEGMREAEEQFARALKGSVRAAAAAREEATAAQRDLGLATERTRELQSALQTERDAAAARDSSSGEERARLKRELDALSEQLRAQTAALLDEKRKLTEALDNKKRAAEAAHTLIQNEVRQCNILRVDLEKEKTCRKRWEAAAGQERTRRKEGEIALREGAEMVAQLEAALAEAQDGAAAATRERDEAEVKLAAEVEKTRQLAAYFEQSLDIADVSPLEERASAQARTAEAAARLAAAEERAAAAESLVTEARALARSREEAIEALAGARGKEAEERRKEGACFGDALLKVTAELDSLTEQLTGERRKAEAAEARCLEVTAKVNSAQGELDRARTESVAVADLLARLEAENERLTESYDCIVKEKEVLEGKLAREREKAEAALKAAAGEADAAAGQLRALELRLQEMQEAGARAEERATALSAAAASKETERHADASRLADSESRLEAEMIKGREAAARAVKQEARGDELAQQLAAAGAMRAHLEAKVHEAEQLADESARALQAAQAARTAAAVREADLRLQLANATFASATWQAEAQRAHAQLAEAEATWRTERERLQAAASSSATWQADVLRLEAALAAAEAERNELSEWNADLEARLAKLKEQADAAAGGKDGAVEEAAAAQEDAAAAREEAAAARQEAEAAARRETVLKGACEKLQAEIGQLKQALAQARATSARTVSDLQKTLATQKSRISELERIVAEASVSAAAMLAEALAKQRDRHQQEMEDAALKERNLSTTLDVKTRAVTKLMREYEALDKETVVLREKVQNSTSMRERTAEAHVEDLKIEVVELREKLFEAKKSLNVDRPRTHGRSAAALPAPPPASGSPRSTLDLEGDSETFASTSAYTGSSHGVR